MFDLSRMSGLYQDHPGVGNRQEVDWPNLALPPSRSLLVHLVSYRFSLACRVFIWRRNYAFEDRAIVTTRVD